ncbi:carbonic anhydrase [Sphingomonas sp. HDW15A]|uniref:carbonic anhydrase n=1 Tax=Sphingomonas sp. HDW15A TaxID=2714942 RepID=UPI00140CC1EF|nr:carbonic anhydrase [Sphingomonas sp. HDW15A]QIK96074.1 carbonic anhydrase [Sphingomonas sp. HDW15A]
MKGFGNLLDGYRRFRVNRFESERERFRELAEGQQPRAIIIACCDSRADPATIFDADPGEIFVVRNVANLVPPFEPTGGRHGVSAALEFAVTQLKVPEIIVMGHERCGGIQAALTGCFHGAEPGEGGFVDRWMEQVAQLATEIAGLNGTGEDAARVLEEAAIKRSLANLRTFPFVAKREAAGDLAILGCHFSIRDGELYLLDEAEDVFRPV